MNAETQQSEMVLLEEKGKEQLAEVMIELIESNPKVIMALYNTMCKCPNLVVQY